jgi:endoglucanase
MKPVLLPGLLLTLALPSCHGQRATELPRLPEHVSPLIRLNQVGFYPGGEKVAVIVTEAGSPLTPSRGPFYITSPSLTDTLFAGRLGDQGYDAASLKATHLADFSAFRDTGTFVLAVPGLGYSYPFRIAKQVYAGLAAASVKAFYFQRASAPLEEPYAHQWSRPEGHPDDHVLVHGSAASGRRPEGTAIACPGGWYDAGDYNKYIVNSGITMGTLLSLYEDFPEYAGGLHTDIPVPDGGVPDLLGEVLWNLRWMLTMQDPGDGGVYHKLTNAVFDPFVMPAEARMPRYVVAKSSQASLDFAAVMAQAFRVYGRYGKVLPGLADSCLSAAIKAWDWAGAHPMEYYDQEALNRTFHPAILTGAYGDKDARDEFAWAAIELYISTGKAAYRSGLDAVPDSAPIAGNSNLAEGFSLPTWSNVRTLGYYSLLRFEGRPIGDTVRRLSAAGQGCLTGQGHMTGGCLTGRLQEIRRRLLSLADNWAQGIENQGYRVVMGENVRDFSWGSNSVAANQGILLIYAYRQTKDKKYLRLALSNLDYLLGRNAAGYCFVTGMGSHSPMHPHHRISESDGVTDPVPGLLVGGPNPGRQDGCVYPSALPGEAYTDQTRAYASNEIAINWNAPLAYLAAACEALQGELP